MRWLIPLGALAALTFSQTAMAAPVSVAEAAISPQFQTTLHGKLGDSEGAVLQHSITRAVSRALRNAGADVTENAGVRIETTIVDAAPNHPTIKQVGDKPGLDMFNSVSIGGAHLSGVIRGADGQVLAEIDNSRYSWTLDDVLPGSWIWTDADRSIDQYARKVAAAYVAHVR